jgi:hypothetical protein
VVSIEILPEGINNYSPRASPSTTPTSSPLSSTFPGSTFRHSQPRPISVIDPTVTFTARSTIVAHSSFTVMRDGQPIHSETADVNLLSTSVAAGVSDIDCIFYYTAPLVPAYWSTICDDPGKFFLSYGLGGFAGPLLFSSFVLTGLYPTDPTKFTIIHDIYQHSGSAVESSNLSEQGYLILSVEYRLSYPESPYPSPQLSPIGSSSSANSSLPSPTSFNGVSPSRLPRR